MKLKEEFKTLAYPGEFRFKEKGSLFIARGLPIDSEESFFAELTAIKKEFYDASHHCYALRLKDDSFKYSDDGEPSGTAGIRIFNSLEHFDIYDAGIIVIRYFGGVKLGTGPLGKAYYFAAEQFLKSAVFVTKRPFSEIIINTSYDFISSIHHHISMFDTEIKKVDYTDNVSFIIEINPGAVNDLRSLLINACSGNVEVLETNNTIYKSI